MRCSNYLKGKSVKYILKNSQNNKRLRNVPNYNAFQIIIRDPTLIHRESSLYYIFNNIFYFATRMTTFIKCKAKDACIFYNNKLYRIRNEILTKICINKIVEINILIVKYIL